MLNWSRIFFTILTLSEAASCHLIFFSAVEIKIIQPIDGLKGPSQLQPKRHSVKYPSLFPDLFLIGVIKSYKHRFKHSINGNNATKLPGVSKITEANNYCLRRLEQIKHMYNNKPDIKPVYGIKLWPFRRLVDKT